ncbi:MAG: hypothetical protein M3496_14750 [Pseudomonadota bacterium]|nr:hypothetical protein [Burkholderiaceae bacterium]MDQ3447391.1 hypothetical protein [Pseudomonadota bacterium]
MREEYFADVQRLVLHGSIWNFGRHLSLEFPKHVQPSSPLRFSTRSHPLAFLATKRDDDGTPLCRPTGAWPANRPQVQLSIGISRRGLAALDVPAHVRSCFAVKTPAFTAGAALRSSHHLGTAGRSAPPHWDEAFHHMKLDAVLSLHGEAEHPLDCLVHEIEKAARHHDVVVRRLPWTRRLANPAGEVEAAHNANNADRREEWSHFGFRDGLARVGIHGWTQKEKLAECKPSSIHDAGEFVLGYPQDSGANPYIAGPGLRVWPEEVRAFFRNGSFAVLHQMEQHIEVFDEFVAKEAERLEIDADKLKAKLCGRYPDGRVLSGAQAPGRVDADFDFAEDAAGRHCPFGSHIRRMNPRAAIGADGALAHAARSRALLRRGMPYVRDGDDGSKEHGFVGHFFCASIEDQFEHLVGQWGERVPLGSADRGGARDPLIGAHEHDDGDFEIPQDDPKASLTVKGLPPFVRVVGTSYLFYPSLSTFDGIVASKAWIPDDDEADW